MSKSAGRVLLIPQGVYDATKQYEMLDLVSYEGIGYICKKRSLGNIPTNLTYWQPNGVLADPIGRFYYVTPQMFGAKADGIHDDWLAIKTAFAHNNFVYFPEGIYYVSKHNEYITLSGNVTFQGEGKDKSVIKFGDTTAAGLSLFAGTLDSITIHDMGFESTLTELNYNTTNTAQLLYLTQATSVNIERCAFKNWRGVCMSSSYSENVTLLDNAYYKIMRDSNRFLEAINTHVENCYFELCGDDIVSFHNTNQTKNGKHDFVHNHTLLSYGCGYLGCSNIFISENNFEKTRMLFKIGIHNTEGKLSENVYFENNIVTPINCDALGSNITNLRGACNNVYFRNNNIEATTPHIETLLLAIGNAYTNVSVYPYCVLLYSSEGTVSNVYIENNELKSGAGKVAQNRHSSAYIDFSAVTRRHIVVKNNLFFDCLNNAIIETVANNYVIEYNIFNCDPYNAIATDGIFSASTACRPFPGNSNAVKYNDFYNTSGDYADYGDGNRFHSDVMNSYKGCNPIRVGSNIRYTIVPFDYENQIDRNDVLNESSSMPSSGYYCNGHYVRKRNPSTSSVAGWVRLTSGNGHVLDTDWREVKYASPT